VLDSHGRSSFFSAFVLPHNLTLESEKCHRIRDRLLGRPLIDPRTTLHPPLWERTDTDGRRADRIVAPRSRSRSAPARAAAGGPVRRAGHAGRAGDPGLVVRPAEPPF